MTNAHAIAHRTISPPIKLSFSALPFIPLNFTPFLCTIPRYNHFLCPISVYLLSPIKTSEDLKTFRKIEHRIRPLPFLPETHVLCPDLLVTRAL